MSTDKVGRNFNLESRHWAYRQRRTKVIFMRGTSRSAVFAFLLLLGGKNGMGQPRGRSPSDLVAFLTYQSDRPGKSAVMSGVTGCGHSNEDRMAAQLLSRFGMQ